MTGAEFKAAREAIGWERAPLARMLGCGETTLRQMESGKQSVPPEIAKWIKHLAVVHERNPPPIDWKRR